MDEEFRVAVFGLQVCKCAVQDLKFRAGVGLT